MENDMVTATEIVVMRMYTVEDKSYRDIAVELGIDYFVVSNILNNLTSKEESK